MFYPTKSISRFTTILALSLAITFFGFSGSNATSSFNQALNSELASVTTSITPKPKITTPVYQFPRTLKLGSTGPDVKQLQIYLNTDPSTQVATKGAGSPNNETTYYGPATSKAVSKLQLKYKSDILTPSHLTQGTGYFGPSTLKKLNSLLTLQPSTSNNLTTTTNTATCPNGNTIASNCTQSPSIAILTTTANITTGEGGGGSAGIGASSVVTTSGGGSGTSGGGSSGGGSSSGGSTYTPPVTPPTPPIISTPGAIIVPGTGWSDPTPQPSNQGSSSQFGYNDNAIARWDVVPYQTFTGNFNVGVVAFHNSGIDHVSFSVNNGPWTNVSQMSANPQTANTTGIGNPNPNGVVEYWATLRASDFKDGPIEVRAIAYPKVGVPRVLQGSAGAALETVKANGVMSLMLNADAGNTLPHIVRYVSTSGDDTAGDGTLEHPFASIRHAAAAIATAQGSGDGATIYLLPGSYTVQCPDRGPYATNSYAWLTIMPAPGYTKNDVIITGSSNNILNGDSGLNIKLLRLKDVTITGGFNGSWALLNVGKISAVWSDNDTFQGTNITSKIAAGINGNGGFNLKFATNCLIDTGDDGFNGWAIVKDSRVQHIAGAPFRNVGLAVNSVAIDVGDRLLIGPLIHPDTYQQSVEVDNAIAYGLVETEAINWCIRLTSAGGQTIKDFAMVNSTFTTQGYEVMDLGNIMVNSYFLNDIFTGGGIVEYPSTLVTTDVVFRDVTFYKPPASWPGLIVINSQNLTYNLTVNAVNGTVTTNPSQSSYTAGTQVTLTATPVSGYEFSNWSGGASGSSNPLVVTMNNNEVITANFSQVVTQNPPPNPPIAPSLTNGLVGYWTMDSADINWNTNSINDASNNGKTGTLIGMSTASNSVTGKFGQALSFNGTSNYMITSTAAGLGTNPVTLSAWIKTSSKTNQEIITQSYTPSQYNGQFKFLLSASGHLSFADYADGSGGYGFVNVISSGTVPIDGLWHQVAFVRNGMTGMFYIDGNQDSTVNATKTISLTNGPIVIGEDNRSANNYFNGYLDDVRIYNRALSATEIGQLYNGTLSYHDAAPANNQSFLASVSVVSEAILHFFGF